MTTLRLFAVALVTALVASGCVWRTVASVDIGGNEATIPAELLDVSGTGRYVLLATTEALDPLNDLNADWDVYRRDLRTGQTRLVSIVDGTQASPLDGRSRNARISANGRWVVFVSTGTNVPGQPGGGTDRLAFVRDMNSDVVTFDSVVDYDVRDVDMSDDGQTIAWIGTNSVGANRLGWKYRNLPSTVTTAVDASTVDLSADGRVTFVTTADAIDASDTNGVDDGYRYEAGWTRVTTNAFATQGLDPAVIADVSDDGRRVLFGTTSSNMAVGDTNGARDFFVKDVVTGSISWVSVDESGTEFAGGVDDGSLDGTGAVATFATAGSMYRHRVAGSDTLDISPDDGTSVSDPVISGDGNYAGYVGGSQVSVQFLESPVVDAVTPATVPVGATTSVTIEGSGFLNDANLFVTGRAGVTVTNVVLVDFETITADVTVDPGTAAGSMWVNVETVGTGPGVSNGAFGNCGTCLAVS